MINLSFARMLNALSKGEKLNYGSFRGTNRLLLEEFLSNEVLDYLPVGNQQKKIFCNNNRNLETYLQNKHGIPSLDNLISFLENEDTQRSDAVKAASNSKYKRIKVFKGFLVNTYEDAPGSLNGQSINLKPAQGAFIFINDYNDFKVTTDITIVGVENHENFREIERQRHLFKEITPLFLWRYQNSNSIAEWLQMIPNNYLHFGDYDPKGLHIYLSEFKNKIGAHRCKLLVPENLDALISSNGEKALYEDQHAYLQTLANNDDAVVNEVLRIIKKYKKGLSQEMLIE